MARVDRNRPHVCDHTDVDGSLSTEFQGQKVRFASHDALAFHLVRYHLLSLSIVNKCYVDCPMLDSEAPIASA